MLKLKVFLRLLRLVLSIHSHRLNDFGMNVKKDSNPYNMHHKTFIVDGEIVITGSYNPTGAGSDKNDENVVVIYDKKLAGKYLEEFWKVWGEG